MDLKDVPGQIEADYRDSREIDGRLFRGGAPSDGFFYVIPILARLACEPEVDAGVVHTITLTLGRGFWPILRS